MTDEIEAVEDEKENDRFIKEVEFIYNQFFDWFIFQR